MKTITECIRDNKALELVEYDQAHNLVGQYTLDTPHYHQCGFIAQSFQKHDERTCAVAGGEIDEEGQ